MTYENILVAVEGPLTTITINRERVRNALNQATIAEIDAALRAFDDDASQRVAIITGAGDRAFAAGADITEIQVLTGADAARRFSEAAHHLGLLMRQMGKPIIAAINGFALGGGLELAMNCDIRIAADTREIWATGDQPGNHSRMGRHSTPAAPGWRRRRASDLHDRRYDHRRRSFAPRSGGTGRASGDVDGRDTRTGDEDCVKGAAGDCGYQACDQPWSGYAAVGRVHV
jgi:hypothetical protein